VSSLMLEGKSVVIFGGGGSIGAAVATEMAVEGAEVFLAGRSKEGLDLVAEQITSAGSKVAAQVIDALDPAAVDGYFETVMGSAGRVDVVLNVTGPRISEYGNGREVISLSVDEFMLPAETILRSNFITAQAAARRMIHQKSGVIIFLTGSPARPHGPGMSAIGAAFAALENLTRALAIELGPSGVRSVCLRIAANPDSRTIQDTTAMIAELVGVTQGQALARLAEATLLKVSPTVADTARAAMFLASDWSSKMTGTVLNSSAGAVTD
jgi:3-oxoacyl-[acyl-carrier protein] reductase